MALSDWRHRRPERNQDYEDAPGHVPAWGVVLTVGFVVMLLLALVSAYQGWNDQAVTNAPAGSPPSTQQPDTTPPANPDPAR